MAYFTYILQSQRTGRYYIGSTSDVSNRVKRHNAGHVRSTKSGIPYILVHCEQYPTLQEAYRRERQIKRYKGGAALKNLIQS